MAQEMPVRKNVANWDRALRLMAGVALVVIPPLLTSNRWLLVGGGFFGALMLSAAISGF